jgi:hypothetical protein
VSYRHGIPNRADELVAKNATAQALIRAGILTMGDYSYYAPTVRLYAGDTAKVRIGRFSSVAPDVDIFVDDPGAFRGNSLPGVGQVRTSAAASSRAAGLRSAQTGSPLPRTRSIQRSASAWV